MPYIYYKGKKYGDGTNQEIKAISIDKFIESNFDITTPEGRAELEAFIQAYNTDGFVIGVDESGYILVPGSDELRIENAILTDEEANGLIIKEFPEEIDVLLNNGVQGYYTGLSDAVIVQGLRCVMGNGYWTDGPSYTESGEYSWNHYSGNQEDSNVMIGPYSASSYNVTVDKIIKDCEDDGHTYPNSSLYTIQRLIKTGEIEKFIYNDFIVYSEYTNLVYTPTYVSVVFTGYSGNLYKYNVMYWDQANSKFITSRNTNGLKACGFAFREQPDIFGLIPTINLIQFSNDSELCTIDSEWRLMPISGTDEVYFKNSDSGALYRTSIAYDCIFYHNPSTNKNEVYQHLRTETIPDEAVNGSIFQKLIGEEHDFIKTRTALAKTIFIPIGLKVNSQGKYEQIPCILQSGSQKNIYPEMQQTLQENLYNRSLTKRTEPVNWLDLRANLGID